jgi:hypothetical protein
MQNTKSVSISDTERIHNPGFSLATPILIDVNNCKLAFLLQR